MKPLYCLCLILSIALGASAQNNKKMSPEQQGLLLLTDHLGLHPKDISFRQDYHDPDGFRLSRVAALMSQPLDMIGYVDELRDVHIKGQPEILASILFEDLAVTGQSSRSRPYRPQGTEAGDAYTLYFLNQALNQFLARMAVYIDQVFPRSTEMMLAPLSKKQKRFLTNEFKEIITSDLEEEFYTVEQHDSLEKAEEKYADQFVEFAGKIDKDPIIRAGIDCLKMILLETKRLRKQLQGGEDAAEDFMRVTGFLPDNTDLSSFLGRQPGWAIGGPDNDYYSGDYYFILDIGGDDIYDLEYDPNNPHGVIIIDFSGNDSYRSRSDFTLGSGCLSVGILVDFEGDDRYDAKSFSLGSGYFGFGILYDAAGDDRYDGDTHVQGAGSFGLGLLIDEGGRDIYNGALFAQGFGFIEGCGLIVDSKGSDSYYAGGKYKDILRYDDHYLSLSQGFGYGLRPIMSGGIGGIIDLEGNDSYYSDIFGQGSSYWWSLGFISDKSGNDNYHSFQYAQGAAAHMSLGILTDDRGNDVYFSKGVSQGCGHDYSAGILLDRAGNDTYTAYDLSQAAGSANGVGILIDNSGDDRYFIHNPKNSQGYGNPRRDFGSIGLFIDLGGSDQYLGNGRDDFFWQTKSKWGGGMDIELNPAAADENKNEN